MKGGDAFVGSVAGVLAMSSAGLATAAGTMAQTGSRNANGFTVGAVSCIVAAIVLVLLYFVGHPLIRRLSRYRQAQLEAYPASPKRLATRQLGRTRNRGRGRNQATVGVAITKALYGEFSRRNSYADVTSAVQALVQNGRLDFVVSNEALGGDPLPDVPKVLQLEYRIGAARQSGGWAEGERVSLPSQN